MQLASILFSAFLFSAVLYLFVFIYCGPETLFVKPSFKIIRNASRCLRSEMHASDMKHMPLSENIIWSPGFNSHSHRQMFSEAGWTQICLASVMRESTACIGTDSYMMRWMNRIIDITRGAEMLWQTDRQTFNGQMDGYIMIEWPDGH